MMEKLQSLQFVTVSRWNVRGFYVGTNCTLGYWDKDKKCLFLLKMTNKTRHLFEFVFSASQNPQVLFWIEWLCRPMTKKTNLKFYLSGGGRGSFVECCQFWPFRKEKGLITDLE